MSNILIKIKGLDSQELPKGVTPLQIMHETKGKTLLVITHDNTILPYMDEVVNINELH